MKKLVFLCVALLVAPAMADVTFDGSETGGVVTISYTSTDAPRGVALLLTCTGTVEITGYVAADADYNCFIDYAFTNPDGYDVDPPPAEQHPLADPDNPGVIPALPATVVSVCMGVLDTTGAQGAGPANADPLVQLTVTGEGTIEMTADTLRGPDSGVVGSEIPSNLSDGAVSIDVGDGIVECIKADSPLYDTWSDLGKPDCWCYARNCRGDADGKKIGDYWVQGEDLNILIDAYFDLDGDLPVGGICADFDHKKIGDYRVQGEDLNILIEYYFDEEGDISECPKDWDGDLDDDYNDWKVPL